MIYRNPDTWTNERLEKETWRFEGIRTLPGKTYVRDINGNIISGPYMLCICDIDSESAYRKCQKELQNDWMNVTYVTKTRKDFGFHIYWLEEWTDDNDFITIDDNDLKSQDSLFEIGIGLKYTQLAGRHRRDPNFRYRNIGCLKLRAPEIMIRNGLYNALVGSTFKDLLLDVNDIKRRRKMQLKNKNPFHGQQFNSYGAYDNEDNTGNTNPKNLTFNKLTDWQIKMISLWACQFYGINDHYYFFMRSFLGTLVWYRVDEESAFKIIDRVCDQKPSSEPKSKWYDLLSSSYQTLINGGNVEGRRENYFAPKVIGYSDIKKGLLLCAASTNLDTNRKKLGAALLGDPGTAKSLLSQEATKLVANSTFVSAQSSSAISLTAIVETEKDSHVLGQTGDLIPVCVGLDSHVIYLCKRFTTW